jgi:hypothetical protein
MYSTDEHLAAARMRLKTRDLARTCGWLDAVLCHQDRILALVDALDDSRDALSWMRRWTALDEAASRLFRVERTVLAPAIAEMGLRAHGVIAEMYRIRIRHDLDDLRAPSWEDERLRVRQLALELAGHFAQQESCAYRGLARHGDDRANAELARQCLAMLADPVASADAFPATHRS